MKTCVNDWELPLDSKKVKDSPNYNLDNIYEHAHSELSLQQSKRDQIITIYLALCSFLIPFALGEEIIGYELKGLIFLVVGAVGILFSCITVRYREYKEVYWLCCQTITVLESFKSEELDKSLVQRTFYHCLHKKGKGYLKEKNGKKILKKFTYARKNIFSSETLHFVIIDLMASFISGLGAALALVSMPKISLALGIVTGIAVFVLLIVLYFRTCIKVYMPLEENGKADCAETKNRAFNRVFSKAWFLHFYHN